LRSGDTIGIMRFVFHDAVSWQTSSVYSLEKRNLFCQYLWLDCAILLANGDYAESTSFF
jgi:hypothetical protein